MPRDAQTVDNSPPDPDPWEVHATWWQDGFTDGADAEYVEQILPPCRVDLPRVGVR